jgi:hypothetical protein
MTGKPEVTPKMEFCPDWRPSRLTAAFWNIDGCTVPNLNGAPAEQLSFSIQIEASSKREDLTTKAWPASQSTQAASQSRQYGNQRDSARQDRAGCDEGPRVSPPFPGFLQKEIRP